MLYTSTVFKRYDLTKIATETISPFYCHQSVLYNISKVLKGLAQAKIIKKSVILFRVLNMTI